VRIAILCLGSHGDVRPCIALGCALKAQGHCVWIGTNPAPMKNCAFKTSCPMYPGDLYSARPETWNFDRAKTPGFADRKRAHIANIELFTIDEPRELSRRSKSKFQAVRSITASFSACMGQGIWKKFRLVFNLAQILRNSLHSQFEILSEKLKEIDAMIFHIGVFSIDTCSEVYRIPSMRIHFYPEVPTQRYPCSIFPPRLPFERWANLLSHYLGPQFIWFFLRSIINKIIFLLNLCLNF